jgi:hypothetical protein
VNERDEQQAKQSRNKEADTKIHDRFDHDATPPTTRRCRVVTMACGCTLHHIHEPLT